MSDKKTLFINNIEVEFTDEKTVLEVIRNNGFDVPTFCHRPDLTQFGACRMCIVEQDGKWVQASCTMLPKAGIKIETNSAKVRKIRKTILELLLANHKRECLTCEKSGDCELQKYAAEYGITDIRFPKLEEKDYLPVDNYNPSLVRDSSKCILCGACVRACNEFQGHGVLGFVNRGSNTRVEPMNGRYLSQVDCVYCGQCQAVCPTGAISIKSDIDRVWEQINNKDKKVVVQFAPSVRVALGEEFNIEPGENTIGKIYSAARRLGFDLIFDTNFSADLTIMEEANEFVNRLTNGEKLPLFTSCCPAWVRYIETHHPELIPNLSTCKSPQGMFSPVAKAFLPKYYDGYTKENITVVSVMPCTAKKYEAVREQLYGETDIVLTTREFAKMIRSAGIDFKNLKEEKADSPFGQYTGAATIFGASGGVAEAAVRTAYYMVTGEELSNVDFNSMRGVGANSRTKDSIIDVKGTPVKVRVVSTLKEAEKSIKEIQNKTADFHILEVMACPGGCVNGGGQPVSCLDSSIKAKRAEGLYTEDKNLEYRKSHQNPDIIKLYKECLGGKPGSSEAHHLLHTEYTDKFKSSYIDIK